MAKKTRLSVNLRTETVSDLRFVMGERGLSATEVVRRAIALSAYLEAETLKGNKIQIRDDKAKTTQELILL